MKYVANGGERASGQIKLKTRGRWKTKGANSSDKNFTHCNNPAGQTLPEF